MDAGRFGRLLRRWATRRGALRLAGGAAAGTLAGFGVSGDAAGTGKKGKNTKKKGCPAGKKACGKKCIPHGNCCKAKECNADRAEACVDGRCDCPPGWNDHNGRCGEPAVCLTVGQICFSDQECCSLRCSVPSDNPAIVRCAPGTWACYTDYDCDVGYSCRGYHCHRD